MNNRIINDIVNFIFVEYNPQKVDAIFLPGGSHPQQPEYAAELYKQSIAPILIVSGGVSVKKQKFDGVPMLAIYGEDKSGHTRDNAFLSRKVVDGNGLEIKTAIIVCKSRPSQIVNKSLSMLMDIDTRIFDKLSDGEREKLHTQIHRLNDAVSLIENEVASDGTLENKIEVEDTHKGHLLVAERHIDEPFVYCKENKTISNLNFALNFSAIKYNEIQSNETDMIVYFVNEKFKELCPIQEIHIVADEITKVYFSLNASASNLDSCYLVIKSSKDAMHEAQSISKFRIEIAFNVEFDF